MEVPPVPTSPKVLLGQLQPEACYLEEKEKVHDLSVQITQMFKQEIRPISHF